MRFLLSRLVIFLLVLGLFLSSIPLVRADDCAATDYDCQIAAIQREINALKPAQEKNQQELNNLKKQVSDLKKRIVGLGSQLVGVQQNIVKREEDLGVQKSLLAVRARSLYIRSRQFSPIMVFLTSGSATQFTRELAIREQATAQDRNVISNLSTELSQLAADKKTLEQNKTALESAQHQVDDRAKFLSVEVEKVSNYLSQLSAKQSQLLALKAGGFATSVGDMPPSLEPCSGPPGSSNFCNPGYSAIAAFSFGAPHRKGMSQFGAKGRAEAGQNYEDILKAYYGNVRIETRGDLPGSIKTSAGTLPLEDNYLMGIAEMPSNWHPEALKAQAIAARTYALSYVGWRNGNPAGATGSICTTEACQVYNSGKAANPPQAWRDAVNVTRGKVLISNNTNETFASWFASTAGGYTFAYNSEGHNTPGGWDTSSGRDGWPDNAWDKKAGSPWFYKGWYRTRGGNSCGRSNPWLTQEEFADILNSWVVYKSGDLSRISPVTTSCLSGNPYSMSEMKQRAQGAGGAYSSISSVSVVYGNDGQTQNVSIDTDRGNVTIPAQEFKTVFNLRAPGYIGIKSGLFNLVKL